MKRQTLLKLKHGTLRGLKLFMCLFSILLFSSFQHAIHESEVADGSRLTSLYSDDFSAYVDQIYNELTVSYYGEVNDFLGKNVLEKGLRGYNYLKHTQQLRNPKYLTIIDFSQYCNKKRMWVIDMESRYVVFNERVAHGARTGDEYAKYFSNAHKSHKTSLGFYSTGGTYNGSKKFSLKLNGLERNFNTNAFARGIVIHGANYVSDKYLDYNRRIGRSFGCPAVSPEINRELINTIKNGSCLFLYHPTERYLENSKIMNGNVYMTVDELHS